MIRQIHKLLVSNRLTRSIQRNLVYRTKRILKAPDAFADLNALIQRTSPDAVLDIGSHVGDTISRILESNTIPIHGFEPTPSTFEKLANQFANHPLVTLHNVALSDKTGEAIFHVNANEQTNSLLDNDQGNDEAFPQHTRHIDRQVIQTIRMDEWMAQHLPSGKVVIKSDVQGAEGLLLTGGMKSFRDQVIGFYSEAQIAPMYKGQLDLWSMHKLLVEELDFVLHNLYPCFHDGHGRALQTDALWIKKECLKDV